MFSIFFLDSVDFLGVLYINHLEKKAKREKRKATQETTGGFPHPEKKYLRYPENHPLYLSSKTFDG